MKTDQAPDTREDSMSPRRHVGRRKRSRDKKNLSWGCHPCSMEKDEERILYVHRVGGAAFGYSVNVRVAKGTH